MSSQDFDAIIIGGGHNGLTCATYLARSGVRVLVLEAAEQPGGLAASYEFAPGFTTSVAHTLPQLGQHLVSELQLEQHGFALACKGLNTVAMNPQGSGHIQITDSGLVGADDADRNAWQEYHQMLHKFATLMDGLWHKAPPMAGSGQLADIKTLAGFALKMRLLGRDDMREFMRVMFLPAQDLMDEFFTAPHLKAALSWDAVLGSKLAPRSPNNAVLNLLLRMSGHLEGCGSLPLPRGGAGSFSNALAAAAAAAGVELRCNKTVNRVICEDNHAVGVALEDGTRIMAKRVISNADPKTSYLDLLGARHLDVGFTHRINRLRNDGMVARVNLALDCQPQFNGLERPDGRMILAPDMAFIENAFDEAKYGGFAAKLPMEIILPTLHDDSLAPAGAHIISALVQYAPYNIKGGWFAHKERLLDNVLSTIGQYAPGVRSALIASEVLTPADLEQRFRVRGGHWHHAEFAIDNWWMNRPTYGASQYGGPVDGFYLCGAGSHPGGGVMGAAGRNAAQHILAEEK